MCESTPTSPNLSRHNSPEYDNVNAGGISTRQRRVSVHARWTRLLQKARRQSYDELRCSQQTIGGAPPSECARPEQYVQLLSVAPYVQSFTWLRKKLTQCDSKWMLEFLEINGLEILFLALSKLSQTATLSVAYAYAQVQVVACFKAVMDSRNQCGLDYLIADPNFPTKLASELETDNITLKKQVFDLLSALCLYSEDGYKRTLETLKHYKNLTSRTFLFSLVVDDLAQPNVTTYKTTLVAFINSVYIETDDVRDRIKLRNELVGLKLLDVLTELRESESADADFIVQLDVFDENIRTHDDELMSSGPDHVDLNNPVDVFNTLYKQVSDTPHAAPFLTVLQHLLRIEPNSPLSATVWDVTEKLVHNAVLLENKKEFDKLLQRGERELAKSAASYAKESISLAGTLNSRGTRGDEQAPGKPANGIMPPSENRKRTSKVDDHQKMSESAISSMGVHSVGQSVMCRGDIDDGMMRTSQTVLDSKPPPPTFPPPPPPPPPPAPPSFGGLPLPPPPPPPLPGGCGPPPPPPPIGGKALNAPPAGSTIPSSSAIPSVRPKIKMRSLNWSKLPPHKVMSSENSIWATVNTIDNGFRTDWDTMEKLFCQQNLASKTQVDGKDDKGRQKKDSVEVINLLDGRRSLNVNIFLRQFKSTNEEIVRLIKQGKSATIGAEKLKSLIKIIPEPEEAELLKSFDGDKMKLGPAEKFYLSLLEVPFYKLRVECMVLKENFTSNMEYLIPSIGCIIEACREIHSSSSLQEILHLVLLTGNFLNAGGYAGNAVGFKVSSLLKLVETRANKPRMNLMHYVVSQAQHRDENLLKFPEELTHLEEASRFTVDQLISDVDSLEEKVNAIASQIEQQEDESITEVKKEVQAFISSAQGELEEVRHMLTFVEKKRFDIANYFCEDPATFNLEECIITFKIFCQKFKKAQAENEIWRRQEIQIEQRKKQREEQQVMRKDGKEKNSRSQSLPSGNETGSIVNKILGIVKRKPDGGKTEDGGRPSSSGPDGEDQQPLHLNRGTPIRRSKQKFEQNLNAITETAAEHTNPEENSSSSGIGTWSSTSSKDVSPPSTVALRRNRSQSSHPRPLSADDTLYDMLTQGNDLDALQQFDAPKRDGSLRRSGRRVRKSSDLVGSETRERTDSPIHSPRHSPPTARRPRSDSTSTVEEPAVEPPKENKQINVAKEKERIRDLMRKDKGQNHALQLKLNRSQSELSKPALDLALRTISDPSTDKASAEIKKDRIAKYTEITTTNKSDLKSESPKNIETPESKTQKEESVNNTDNTPAIPTRRRSLRRSQSALNNQDIQKAAANIGDNRTNALSALPSYEDNLDDKISDWQSKAQTVEMKSSKEEDKPRANEDRANALDRTQNARSFRRRSNSLLWDTPKLKEERSERRRSADIYKDHESTVFLDRPIEAGLAKGLETYTNSYSQKIRKERQAIENIMTGNDETDESVASRKISSDLSSMKGLEALRAKYRQKQALAEAFDETETWASIDRQQVAIRRDLLDMKTTTEDPQDVHLEDIEAEDDESLPQTTNPSDGTVISIQGDDVYILKDQRQAETTLGYPDENANELASLSSAVPSFCKATKASSSHSIPKSDKLGEAKTSSSLRRSPSKNAYQRGNISVYEPLPRSSPRVRKDSRTGPAKISSSRPNRMSLHSPSRTTSDSKQRRESSESNPGRASLGSTAVGGRNGKSQITGPAVRSNSAASSCSTESDRKPRTSSMRSTNSSGSVRTTSSKGSDTTATATRTGPFTRSAPERRTLPASTRMPSTPSRAGRSSTARQSDRNLDKPANESVKHIRNEERNRSPSPKSTISSTTKAAASPVRSNNPVRKSNSFQSPQSPGFVKTSYESKTPVKMGTARFGLSDHKPVVSVNSRPSLQGGIQLVESSLGFDKDAEPGERDNRNEGRVSSLSLGETSADGISARISSLYSNLNSKSEREPDDSEDKCGPDRGSTLSLPTEVRKRRHTDEMAKKPSKGKLSNFINKLGRKTDKGYEGRPYDCPEDVETHAAETEGTVPDSRKSLEGSTNPIVRQLSTERRIGRKAVASKTSKKPAFR